MKDYYAQKLSAERLRQVYEIAPPRVQQYLDTEIKFVLSKIKPTDTVLELGCCYGRVLQKLSQKAKKVFGIDTSIESLCLAQVFLRDTNSVHLFSMNAIQIGFRDQQLVVVICIQNGISAFKVDQRKLMQEAIQVIHPGGIVLFSGYYTVYNNFHHTRHSTIPRHCLPDRKRHLVLRPGDSCLRLKFDWFYDRNSLPVPYSVLAYCPRGRHDLDYNQPASYFPPARQTPTRLRWAGVF